MKEGLVPAFAISIIHSDSLIIEKTYGLGSIENEIRASVDTTLFELGSVGKVFTAIAVLQQVHAGKLDLHRDVNEYLIKFKVQNPYKKKVTLFHLLTHTAGFNDQVIGYMARNNASLQPLGEHLKENLPDLFQAPGIEINYSNYGYALAGHLVEIVSGQSFKDYVRTNILQPLKMNNTSYFLPDVKDREPPYATGYRIRDTFEAVQGYPRHALPAGSIVSTTSDMTKFIKEILNPTNKILQPEMHRFLMSQQFSNHPLLMGYSLGMEEQWVSNLKGFGKGGSVPGFLSSILFLPTQNIAVFVATNTQTDNFFERFSASFLQTFFPDTIPIKKESLKRFSAKKYVGVYRSNRYNHHNIEELQSLYSGKFELFNKGDSLLTCYHNNGWQTYAYINDSIFININNRNETIVFSLTDGKISGLSRGVKIGLIYVPNSYERVPWYDHPDLINEDYAFVLLTILSFSSIWLFRLWVMIKRRKSPQYFSGKLLSTSSTWLTTVIILLYSLHIFGAIYFMLGNATEFLFEVPERFRYFQMITYSFPFLVLALMWCMVQEWQRAKLPFWIKLYFTLVTLAITIHFLFLWRWHFIGLNF